MKSAIAFATALLLALLSTFSAAHAGTAGAATAQPQVVLQAWQVQSVFELGATRESLQPLKGIRPGDVVEYEARYVNTTAKAAQHVQLTLPVPAGGLAYLPQAGAATPVDSASVDGVRFEPVPLRREVRLPDGRRVTQDVPLADYRFLRWNLGTLPAGAERAVRARMQLPAVTTTASR